MQIAFLACSHAQSRLPDKTLTIALGFAPGGALDTAARIVAQALTDNLRQPVVVVNRPGAGGNIAQQAVYSGPADGSTLLFGTIGSLTINPHLMAMPYDPLKDLAPVVMGVSFPNVLVVNKKLGVKTLAEFVALAKTKQLDYASSGVGSASHIGGEMFNQLAGINMTHVSYKGGNLAMLDLLAGRVAAYYATPSSALAYIESGDVVALATSGLQRTSTLPNVPTIAESGYPGFNATNWYAFVAPAKTPAPVLDWWNAELTRVLTTESVQAQLAKHGLFAQPGTREQLGQFMANESRQWEKVIRERRITAQ